MNWNVIFIEIEIETLSKWENIFVFSFKRVYDKSFILNNKKIYTPTTNDHPTCSTSFLTSPSIIISPLFVFIFSFIFFSFLCVLTLTNQNESSSLIHLISKDENESNESDANYLLLVTDHPMNFEYNNITINCWNSEYYALFYIVCNLTAQLVRIEHVFVYCLWDLFDNGF